MTKNERKVAKEVLKRGILRRHAAWLKETRDIIIQGMDAGENEFDLSMHITRRSKDFFKEAMDLEDYYRTSWIEDGLRFLYRRGFLNDEDISVLPSEIVEGIRRPSIFEIENGDHDD